MNLQLESLTAVQLRRAAAIKERIEDLQKEFQSVLGSDRVGKTAVSGGAGGAKGRRKMSAAAKARLAAIARERWKKAKAAGKNEL